MHRSNAARALRSYAAAFTLAAVALTGCGTAGSEPAVAGTDSPPPAPPPPATANPTPAPPPPPGPPVVVDVPPAVSKPAKPDEAVEAGPSVDERWATDCPPPRQQSRAAEPERIEASHLLLQYVGSKRARDGVTRSHEQAQRLINKLLHELCAGADFADLVRRYSDEPGAADCNGRLGSFRRGTMVKPFEEAAFALMAGEFSAVVETDFGFHLILRTK